MLELTIVMFIVFIFPGVMIGITPYITRRETVFGILIPEGKAKDPSILKKKKDFLIINLILCIVFCIPLFIFSGGAEEMMNVMALYLPVALLVYLLIAYVIYFIYHKKMKEFKAALPPEERAVENQKIVVSTDFTKENKVVSTELFTAVNIIIVLVTIAIPIYFFDQIPYQVPTHWGADGTVNVYSERSIGLFLVNPIIQLVMIAIMVVANHGIKIAKQKINVKKPKVSRAQSIAFRYAMSKFLFILATLVTLLLLMIQWMMVFSIQDGNIIMISVGVIMVPTIVGVIYIAIRYGQGGERYKVSEEEGRSDAGKSYDDDKYWKIGLFYFNPKDPSVWVEKRFGMGMTINYGSPRGIMLIVGILLAMILLVALPFLLGM